MKPNAAPAPYRSTPIFDEISLPAALRREHRTKPGVWGVVRVLDGEVRLSFVDPADDRIVTRDAPGLLLPEQPHFATPIGPMRMRIEFYDQLPAMIAPSLERLKTEG